MRSDLQSFSYVLESSLSMYLVVSRNAGISHESLVAAGGHLSKIVPVRQQSPIPIEQASERR